MRALLSSACLLLVPGCSFMFGQGAPDDHAKLVYFDCVSSKAAPTADVVVLAFSSLGALQAAGDDPASGDDGSRTTVLAVFGTLAAVHAASAIYGFSTASTCHDAKQQLERRLLEHAATHEQLERQPPLGAPPAPTPEAPKP